MRISIKRSTLLLLGLLALLNSSSVGASSVIPDPVRSSPLSPHSPSAIQSQGLLADEMLIYLPLVLSSPEIRPIGPDGGHIVGFVVAPDDPAIMYAGTWGAGIYKSTNGGQTWTLMDNGLGNLYINYLAIDPVTPSTIYAGTQKGGVYKSTDGGANWIAKGSGLNTEAIVYTIAINPSNPSILYAGTRSPGSEPPWGGGVFKSTNGGETWQAVNSGLGEDWVYSLAIDPTSPSTLYAATHSVGVYKSVNSGSSWSAVNNGITDLNARALVINPNFTHTVYVGTWHGGGVFKTTDDGANWSQVDSGLNSAKIFALILDPASPQTLYAASYHRGVYKTTNGGSAWTQAGLNTDFVYRIAKHSGLNAPLFAGTAGDGLYRSLDSAGSWSRSDVGLKATSVTGWVVDAPDLFASVYGGGVFKSTDTGNSWSATNNGLEDRYVHALAIPSPSVLLAGTDTSGVYRSVDGGATWSASNSGMPAGLIPLRSLGAPFNHFPDEDWFDPGMLLDFGRESVLSASPSFGGTNVSVLSIKIDPNNSNTIYLGTGGNGVLKSTNGGSSWSATNLTSEVIHDVAVNPFNASVLIAALDGSEGSMLKSANGGGSWVFVNSGLGGTNVVSVTFDPGTADRLYAGTYNGVFWSTNGGSSWVARGLGGVRVYSVVVNPSDANMLFAGAEDGLHISTDAGASWTLVDDKLVDPHVQTISLDIGNQRIYYGTMGSGGYRRDHLEP